MSGSPLPGPEDSGAATFYESARKHRARLRAFAPSAVLFVLAGAWAAVRIDGLFRQTFTGGVVAAAIIGIVFILAITVWASLFVRAVRDYRGRIRDGSRAPALSVDHRGVTLYNLGARLDWAQIREIVIEQHPLPLPERLAVGSRLRTTIVFIPAGQPPGQVTVPHRRLAGRFRELYGSPFAVDTSTLTIGSDTVTQSVREAAPCPVRHVTS
jgi:hypothetical protein